VKGKEKKGRATSELGVRSRRERLTEKTARRGGKVGDAGLGGGDSFRKNYGAEKAESKPEGDRNRWLKRLPGSQVRLKTVGRARREAEVS